MFLSLIKQFGVLLRETLREWNEDGAAAIAASLAYYAIFSLSPLLIIVALFFGLVLDQASVETNLVDSIRGTVGDGAAQIIRDLIINRPATRDDLAGTIIWISVILWGASGLFAQLQTALNKIWEVKPMPGRSPLTLVKNRVFSFMVVISVGIVLLLTMLINSILNRALQTGDIQATALLVRPVQFIFTVAMTTVLIAAIFHILPDVIIRWRDLWVGSLFTGMLFYGGQFLLGLYLSQSSIGSVFGAAGSLTAILVWIYYSAQILLFGAEFTEVWARHYGASIRPDDDAVWVNESHAQREAVRAKADFNDQDGEEDKTAIFAQRREQRAAVVGKVVTGVRRVRIRRTRGTPQ